MKKKEEKMRKEVKSCCNSKVVASIEGNADAHHHHKKGRLDWLLVGSFSLVAVGFLIFWLAEHEALLSFSPHLYRFSEAAYTLMRKMFWGIVVGMIAVGILMKTPQKIVTSLFGRQGTFKGLLRATIAGFLLDVCSHGILVVGMNLYKKGVGISQIMAFLIASPWNSLSLTIILITLVGWVNTLLFIVLSLVIALVSGLVFERLVKKGVLPKNPHQEAIPEENIHYLKELKVGIKSLQSPKMLGSIAINGFLESLLIIRWLFLGVVLMGLISAFVPESFLQAYFGPTVIGLFLTAVFATIIEVCSEGAVPMADYLVNDTKAVGNAFVFLMAGVSTDYTEIMALRDTTKSWKIALFLPLVTLPQILLLGHLLNNSPFP